MSKNKSEDGVEFPGTCPTDVRYPNQNVTRYCFQMFVDYQRCTRLLGKSHAPCEYFKKCYLALCPFVWISKWHEQMEIGAFPVDLPDEVSKK